MGENSTEDIENTELEESQRNANSYMKHRPDHHHHHHYVYKTIYKATYKIYELIYSSKLKLKYSSIQWLIKMLKISCEVHDKKFKRSN